MPRTAQFRILWTVARRSRLGEGNSHGEDTERAAHGNDAAQHALVVRRLRSQ